MKVVSIPARLAWAALALVLSIPLAAYETILALRAPWWRIPFPVLIPIMGGVAVFVLPIAFALLRGKQWARLAVECIGGVWCLVTMWAIGYYREPALGFFSVFVLAYWLILIAWVRFELGRSFLDSRMRWFQGLPQPISGLLCRFSTDKAAHDLRVSRIDDEGLFVFTSQGDFPGFRKGEVASLMLSFRDRQVRARALPMAMLSRGKGFGFRFAGMSADERKTLGDFVEILRGEGHV